MKDFEELYNYLEANKNELNFIQRDDVVSDFGVSCFKTLFWNEEKKDIPEVVKDFLVKKFNITPFDYDFIQIQKYEIGDYILPHKDSYPCFGLLSISSSNIDGIVIEQRDKTYKFFPDVAGTLHDVPKFRWHWVNPVQEKTRYSAVYGLHSSNEYDSIINE